MKKLSATALSWQLIDHYFAPANVQAFELLCRQISSDLVASLQRNVAVDLVAGLAQPFAVRIQCAFLGWPDTLHAPLLAWVHKNHVATLARDTSAMAAIALEFDGYISELLEVWRAASAAAPDDITTSLLRDQINGRSLSHEEIVSILRNWTVGELGTITACVGILVDYLAQNPQLQHQLRAELALLPAAIDEILRLHAPLISNRRVTTRPVIIGGRKIAAGERIMLMWASANRAETVSGNPDALSFDRNPDENLLYRRGIHVCPGAELARLELRIIMEELPNGTNEILALPDHPSVRAIYPASGFSALPLSIT